MSLGKHLKSHCNTPSAASRDPCGFQGPISWLPGTHIVAGTLIIRRTVKWSHPSLQPLLILQEETTTFSPSCNPSRRLVKSRPGRTNWGLGAGRAGRSSAESPRLVLVFLWPPLRGLDVGAGPPHGGLPLARGSRYFPMGLTSDTSPTLFHSHLPQGVSEGPPMLYLDPYLPCWQGQGSRGTGSAIWDPQKVWGSDFKLIAPPSCSLHNEPHTRAAQSTWQGAWWSGLQPRSLQGPPPSLPAGTPVCCPMHAPEGPEVVHA